MKQDDDIIRELCLDTDPVALDTLRVARAIYKMPAHRRRELVRLAEEWASEKAFS